MSAAKHDYSAYTTGCRCEVCRASKASYMRERRIKARAQASGAGGAVLGIRHGTRHAYEERGCRCEPCVVAKRESWKADRATRARAAEIRGGLEEKLLDAFLAEVTDGGAPLQAGMLALP